eukprot:325198-Hanusia_phi.AAC.4
MPPLPEIGIAGTPPLCASHDLRGRGRECNPTLHFCGLTGGGISHLTKSVASGIEGVGVPHL